jgi:hypothetical protein
MKKILFLASITLLFGCKSQKVNVQEKITSKHEIKTADSDMFIVTVFAELQPGKSLEIKKDDVSGKYYTIVKDGDKTVVKVGWSSTPREKNIADGDIEYSVMFETDNPIRKQTWKNEALQNIKAVSGFFAFHPDSGYVPLKEGKISVKPDAKKGIIIIEIDIPEKSGGKYLNGIYTVKVKK